MGKFDWKRRRRYRLKTEKELIDEFGNDWIMHVTYDSNSFNNDPEKALSFLGKTLSYEDSMIFCRHWLHDKIHKVKGRTGAILLQDDSILSSALIYISQNMLKRIK